MGLHYKRRHEEHHPNWPQILDHLYRILITGVGGSSLSYWYLYIKDTFELNLKVKDSLIFKNEINFEFSVKVKIVCILKWHHFLIDFESTKKVYILKMKFVFHFQR